MIFSISRYFRKHKFEKGFSVIELLVVIFIVGVVSSVIIGNQSSYSETAQLHNIAQNLALDIRRAQIYGITVKEAKAGTSSGFKSYTNGYGLVFRTTSPGSPSQYILYGDRPTSIYPVDPTQPLPTGNGLFDAGVANPNGWATNGCNFDSSQVIGNRNECLQQIVIPTNFSIYATCAIDASSLIYCSNVPSGSTFNQDASLIELDITFNRPSTEARVIFNRDASIYPNAKGAIVILSNANNTKFNYVYVYKSGQISIQ